MKKRLGLWTGKPGSFRTVLMAVLMVATAAIILSMPQQAQAHFGQWKSDPCIDCHNGSGQNLYVSPWDFTVESTFTQDTDAVIYVAVDGVDESLGNGGGLDGTAMQVTVAPSATIELDILWKNKSGGASDMMIKFPDITNWTIAQGTAGSAPTNWNPDAGGVWNTAWDITTRSGGSAGSTYWMQAIGDAGTGGDAGSVPAAEARKFWVVYMENDTKVVATVPSLAAGSNTILDPSPGRVGTDALITVPATPGTYTLRLYAVGHSASKDYKSVDLTVIVSSGGDVTPPALVTNFTATSGQDSQVPMSWTNPADVDLAEVLVLRKTGSYPTDHLDVGATQVYQNLTPVASGAETPTDTTGPPANGTTYYYAVFSRDATGNWNDTVTEASNANTATPSAGDVTPPALVTNFTATSGQDSQVPLSWTNPADVDLAEVLVLRKTGSYPTDHLDVGATQVYQNLSPVASGAETPTDTTGPPVNGTTYYYAVFSRDATGNWNDTVTGGSNANTATPSAGNTVPNDPANLAQLLIDGVTPIAVGGYTTEASVVFEADISDPDGADTVKLQIDTNFDSTFDCESVLVAQQVDYQLTCPLADGAVNWQARTVDNSGAVSNWVPFNAANPDFTKDATAPVDGTLTATPGDNQVDLSWTAASDTHSGLQSPAYIVARSTVDFASASCDTPLTTTDLTTYTDSTAANGTTYYYRVCATNNAGLRSTGATDSATPAAGCSRVQPTVTIQTADQEITTDGGFVNYTVQVTNNDSATCGNSTFSMSAADTNSTNFYSSTLEDASLDIAPQSSLQTVVRVRALANQTNLVTNDTTVTATEATNHDPPVVSTPVTTTINVTGGGCVAPGDYINISGDRLSTSRR